jgi:uncharacterized protein with PQ loop repeat
MRCVIQLVGYVGSAGAAMMWIPQAHRVVRHRRRLEMLEGISLASYVAAIVFNALLVTYGSLNGAAPVVLAGTVNLACASVIATVVALQRRAAR